MEANLALSILTLKAIGQHIKRFKMYGRKTLCQLLMEVVYPLLPLFKKELGLDSILMGFGLDEDAIHSPNESYGLFTFL